MVAKNLSLNVSKGFARLILLIGVAAAMLLTVNKIRTFPASDVM